jgi:hypothetical protein
MAWRILSAAPNPAGQSHWEDPGGPRLSRSDHPGNYRPMADILGVIEYDALTKV